MAAIKYIGPDESVEVFGKTFYRNKPNANHGLIPDHVQRLAHNPTFSVEDYDGPVEDEHGTVTIGGKAAPKPAPAVIAPAPEPSAA